MYLTRTMSGSNLELIGRWNTKACTQTRKTLYHDSFPALTTHSRTHMLDIGEIPVRALPLNDGGKEGVSVDRAGQVGRRHLLSGSRSDYRKPYR